MTSEHLFTASLMVEESIGKIERWTKDWGLKINAEETMCTVLSLSNKTDTPSLTLNSKKLPVCENPTFLGLNRTHLENAYQENQHKGPNENGSHEKNLLELHGVPIPRY